ncbi:alpha/beta hydrolase [Nocardia iowensis]|uniref:Alpha/beta hydrolase n=2 Tax=Nocardia iowensis TaxID=204891 RepID=A0ABX8S1B0_NOCIO|nr:alpha/beta hydrolase [Nocardia iowensis]QXN95740.1 alpha/beta hydrolase [Nocardia iowensis]
MNRGHQTDSSWTGMVPVEDTALAVTDTGDTGTPVIYLNGSYANQKHWRRVIADLGPGWRHITYDERARGRSRRSADYSFEACVRDVGVVLAARGVDRPILVGWSYGAVVGVHWASRNPHRALGVVPVDGAYPYDLFSRGSMTRDDVRRLFRRMRWAFPVARRLGMAARMTGDQHAEVNIELNEVVAEIEPVLDNLTVPVRWVVASGGNLGGEADEMQIQRANLGPVLARNPNIEVSATVASNHSKVLSKDFRAIANAVREVAAVGSGSR